MMLNNGFLRSLQIMKILNNEEFMLESTYGTKVCHKLNIHEFDDYFDEGVVFDRIILIIDSVAYLFVGDEVMSPEYIKMLGFIDNELDMHLSTSDACGED